MQKECNKRHFAVSRNSESICKTAQMRYNERNVAVSGHWQFICKITTSITQQKELCNVMTLRVYMQKK